MANAIVALLLVFFVAGAASGIGLYHFLRGWRDSEPQPRRPAKRDNDRRNADLVWELGQRTHASDRRGLLRRIALGLIGAIVAQQAALGRTLPDGTEFLTGKGKRNTAGGASTGSRVAQNSHIDVPGPGGSYADIPAHPSHGDNPTPYGDNPAPTPYGDNPAPTPYGDNPAPPHTDVPHQDNH
jgi:hypothetical protein